MASPPPTNPGQDATDLAENPKTGQMIERANESGRLQVSIAIPSASGSVVALASLNVHTPRIKIQLAAGGKRGKGLDRRLGRIVRPESKPAVQQFQPLPAANQSPKEPLKAVGVAIDLEGISSREDEIDGNVAANMDLDEADATNVVGDEWEKQECFGRKELSLAGRYLNAEALRSLEDRM